MSNHSQLSISNCPRCKDLPAFISSVSSTGAILPPGLEELITDTSSHTNETLHCPDCSTQYLYEIDGDYIKSEITIIRVKTNTDQDVALFQRDLDNSSINVQAYAAKGLTEYFVDQSNLTEIKRLLQHTNRAVRLQTVVTLFYLPHQNQLADLLRIVATSDVDNSVRTNAKRYYAGSYQHDGG